MLALRRFSRQLRSLRTGRRLSQESLAERAGVSAAYVGMLERGERNPPLTTVNALATALDTDLAALLGEEPGAAGLSLGSGTGEHVLHMYRTEGERREVAQSLMARGLAAYLGPAAPRGRDAVNIDPANHFLGRGGRFDAEGASARLEALFRDLTAGPNVLVSVPPAQVYADGKGVASYERSMDRLCTQRAISCFCQYPAGRLTVPVSLDLLQAHGWLLVNQADGLLATRLSWRAPRNPGA